MQWRLMGIATILLGIAAVASATTAATAPRQATGTPPPPSFPTSLATPEPEPTAVPSDPTALAIRHESNAAMNRLSSLRMVEERRDSMVPERYAPTYADYAFAAPDRFAYADRPEGIFWPVAHVFIGHDHWYRENGGPWQPRRLEAPYRWPDFPRSSDPWVPVGESPVNVHLLREEVLAGQPTWVITYQFSVRGIEGIIHFYVTEWIAQDSHRLLRRLRTDDDAFGSRDRTTLDFTEFDGPVTILPPVTSEPPTMDPSKALYLPRVLD